MSAPPVRAPAGQKAPLPARPTPSCSRCRTKKLKCDQKDPCNQCLAKNVGDECQKDERVPRNQRKRRLDPKTDSDIEIQALRRRLKELEGNARFPSPASTSQSESTASTSNPVIRGATSSARSSDWPSSDVKDRSVSSSSSTTTTRPKQMLQGDSKEHPRSPTPETENAALILERFATSAGSRPFRRSGPGQRSEMSEDVRNQHWDGLARLTARRELLEDIWQSLPSATIMNELIDIFALRTNHSAGCVIHISTLENEVDAFCRSTVEDIASKPVDANWLACFLGVLVLGLQFYPPEHQGSPQINAIRSEGKCIVEWYRLATKCLAIESNFTITSLSGIQAAVLVLVHGREAPVFLRNLLKIAILSAQDMGLHQLGTADRAREASCEAVVRKEVGVRVWWVLVVREWCAAQREGNYSIHASQFNTRRPLNLNDRDLAETPYRPARSLREYSQMSYVLCAIDLAYLIRESVDMLHQQTVQGESHHILTHENRRLLDAKYQNFLFELPPYFRLGSDLGSNDSGAGGIVEVQRYLLHQQAFDLLLKLNRCDLGTQEGRASCLLLAQNILDTQRKIRNRCTVIDSLWINFLHLFGAAIVLLIDLFLSENNTDLTRMMTRSKVREALKALRQTYSARSSRGVRLIEVLLEEEEEAWIRRNDPGGSSSAVVHREVNLVSLARRLVDTTREVELLQDGTEIVPPPSTPKSTDDSFLPALTNWSGEAPPFPSRCPSAKLPQVEQHCVGAEQRQQLVNYQQEQLQEQQQQEQQQQVQSQAQQQPGDHPPTYSSATAHQVTNQDASIVADLSLDEMWNWLIAQSATYGL